MTSTAFDSNIILGGYRDLPATIKPRTRLLHRQYPSLR
jgi:hypothetical protein